MESIDVDISVTDEPDGDADGMSQQPPPGDDDIASVEPRQDDAQSAPAPDVTADVHVSPPTHTVTSPDGASTTPATAANTNNVTTTGVRTDDATAPTTQANVT